MLATVFAAAGWAAEANTAAVHAAASITCDYSGHYGVFADIHDGDMKKVQLSADSKTVTIEPYNNTQTWMVVAAWSDVSCSASIDFNVTGKPNPPPVPLMMSYYAGHGGSGQPTLGMQVFTDPSGTLARPGFPLNTWIRVALGEEMEPRVELSIALFWFDSARFLYIPRVSFLKDFDRTKSGLTGISRR
jgi:hypothetical protein